jgi:hypothetical protein
MREMVEQVNEWNGLKKVEGKPNDPCGILVNVFNNNEFVMNGVKWYVLIAQPFGEDKEICSFAAACPLSLFVFKTMVAGITYAFKSKDTRDFFANAINNRVAVGACRLGDYSGCNGEILATKNAAEEYAEILEEYAEDDVCMTWGLFLATKNAAELLSTADVAPPKQEKVKTKAELKKEQTRNANKVKAEEKKAKEEQGRLAAIAYAKNQADKKKKAREIAIKKQKAWLKEGEKLLRIFRVLD